MRRRCSSFAVYRSNRVLTLTVITVVFRRRTKVAIGVACFGAVAYFALPIIVEHELERRLAERGFPDARLDVASVGLDHLKLRNVHLDEGIDAGSVDLDRGVSLLWGQPEEISVEKARVSSTALARTAPKLQRTRGDIAFKRARIDFTIEVRDPSRNGWLAEAKGQVVVDARSKLTATGSARIDRVDVGPVELANLSVPFSYDERGLRLSATASAFGGELVVDPFVVDRAGDVVVRARGLQLAEVLRLTRHASGSGTLDGQLALRVGDGGWSLRDGELHTRAPGRLSVKDAGLVTSKSPIAVHERIANALGDFELAALSLTLAPAGTDKDLRVSLRGRGRRNHQELDVAVGIRGARDLASQLPGAKP